MTVSALADHAGVAKSTVSLIERGQGNPSIDTVWSLASALGVPFASLFHDEPPTGDVAVVREDDVAVVAVDQAGLDMDGLVIRHMLTRTGGALIEIYTLVLEEGAERHANAHVKGLFEHITVATGTVEISTDSFSEIVGQGDQLPRRSPPQLPRARGTRAPRVGARIPEPPPRLTHVGRAINGVGPNFQEGGACED
jgi:XRE family transcriptional regulator, regulator of sulfur utilization